MKLKQRRREYMKTLPLATQIDCDDVELKGFGTSLNTLGKPWKVCAFGHSRCDRVKSSGDGRLADVRTTPLGLKLRWCGS